MKTLFIIWSLAASMLVNQTFADPQSGALTSKEEQQILRHGIHILGGSQNVVTRWSGTVSYTVIGASRSRSSQLVSSVFNEIYWLTNVEILEKYNSYNNAEEYARDLIENPDRYLSGCVSTATSDCANFIVVITDLATMHSIAKNIPLRPVFQRATKSRNRIDCFFSPGITSTGNIERSIVYVDEKLELDMLDTCLHEEIFQSFGLFNDQPNSPYFSFNNKSYPKRITVFDKALLASLYDRRFNPGTSVVKVANHMIDLLIDGNDGGGNAVE